METTRTRNTVRNVTRELEAEMTRLVTYLNDQVVPEVRRSSSAGLRVAADQLHRMAEHLERASHHAPHPAGRPTKSAAPENA